MLIEIRLRVKSINMKMVIEQQLFKFQVELHSVWRWKGIVKLFGIFCVRWKCLNNDDKPSMRDLRV